MVNVRAMCKGANGNVFCEYTQKAKRSHTLKQTAIAIALAVYLEQLQKHVVFANEVHAGRLHARPPRQRFERRVVVARVRLLLDAERESHK